MIAPALLRIARTIRRMIEDLRQRARRPMPGRFQAYCHTLPDRYPWLFEFARSNVADTAATRLLSFGCSRGDEVFSLRKYFRSAAIKGIDIDPKNIARCIARLPSAESQAIAFAAAATTEAEMSASYDAIFCLAVLCLGDLTNSGAQCCSPHLYFGDFDRVVADFARCLKPGGILVLHTANFRFCDSSVAEEFDVVLEANPAQMAPDVLFGRDNKLMKGARYFPVAFRKRNPAAGPVDNEGAVWT
jgi:SAM-dependent methyltransferase